MNILRTFALLVHWISFIFGGLLFLNFSTAALRNSPDPTLLMSAGVYIFFGIIIFFFCSVLGWLARLALVGRVHFLPWRK